MRGAAAAGVATALKIMFSSEDIQPGQARAPPPPPGGEDLAGLTLERNEVIALINLLARFSNSLTIVQRLGAEIARRGTSSTVAQATADPDAWWGQ